MATLKGIYVTFQGALSLRCWPSDITLLHFSSACNWKVALVSLGQCRSSRNTLLIRGYIKNQQKSLPLPETNIPIAPETLALEDSSFFLERQGPARYELLVLGSVNITLFVWDFDFGHRWNSGVPNYLRGTWSCFVSQFPRIGGSRS